MRTTTGLLASVLGGVLVTLVTGLVPNMPTMLVGAVHYGYPLAWLIRMIVAPEYNPWKIEPLNFIVDVVVWSIIIGAVVFAAAKMRTPTKK